jgi:hypothetical protein
MVDYEKRTIAAWMIFAMIVVANTQNHIDTPDDHRFHRLSLSSENMRAAGGKSPHQNA